MVTTKSTKTTKKSDKLLYDSKGNLKAGLDKDAKVFGRIERSKSVNADVGIGDEKFSIQVSIGEDGMTDADREVLKLKLSDPDWRLFSGELYKITDKNGSIVPFIPNKSQKRLYNGLHNKNIILKARQQGFTTFIALLALDYVLFNAGKSAGLIAHNLDDASKISRVKIHFAYDRLPKWLKALLPSGKRTDSEITFTSNDGGLYVDTSFRGGTLQFLHISEYAKIGVLNPEKAQEIKTGALNAVPKDGLVFIESTSEGPYGEFYEMCQKSMKKQLSGKPLTKMDYKFFFFPWFMSDEYYLEDDEMEGVEIDRATEEYFELLKGDEYISKEYSDFVFTRGQMAWYQLKKEEQGDAMWQEYPSTPKEAFDAVIDGAYYEKETAYLRSSGFVGNYGYDPNKEVHTAWDIGISDAMAIWFFQVHRGGIIHLIDYFEGEGWSMIDLCQSVIHTKQYKYGTHFLPHDAEVRNVITGKTRVDEISEYLGEIRVLSKLPIQDGINRARNILKKCRFDSYNCESGFDHICMYTKERDKRSGIFKAKPKHDEHSHGADAFRYLAIAYEEEYKNKGVVFVSTGLNREYLGYDTTYIELDSNSDESFASLSGYDDISLTF